MMVTVLRMRENGRPVPRWQYNRLPRLRGELNMDYEKDDEGRSRLVARIFGDGAVAALHPKLYDPVILYIRGDMWALKGVEPVGEAEMVQSWWIRLGVEADPASVV